MKNFFTNKRCLVIVAHQDDEALYCGGLLTEIAPVCSKLCIAALTDPAPNRADTLTRRESFVRVCRSAGADCRQFHGQVADCHPATPAAAAFEQLPAVRGVVDELIAEVEPDLIVSHGLDGEPNSVYPGGHVVHKLVAFAVWMGRSAAGFGIARGAGAHTHRCLYDVAAKRALVDCYLPNWDPLQVGYGFAYEMEPFNFFAPGE